MELDTKTAFVNGKFTDLHLSTDQRKRLALVAVLLDDKPVYIFDELAADQAPIFRQRFYEVVLRDLQRQGKTVMAATHDDRYFGVADRVVKMEYGRILEET